MRTKTVFISASRQYLHSRQDGVKAQDIHHPLHLPLDQSAHHVEAIPIRLKVNITFLLLLLRARHAIVAPELATVIQRGEPVRVGDGGAAEKSVVWRDGEDT